MLNVMQTQLNQSVCVGGLWQEASGRGCREMSWDILPLLLDSPDWHVVFKTPPIGTLSFLPPRRINKTFTVVCSVFTLVRQ